RRLFDQGALAPDLHVPSTSDHTSALDVLRSGLADVLSVPAGDIDPTVSLGDLGLDSLGGIQLALYLEERLGMSIPLERLMDGYSLESLAQSAEADRRQHPGSVDLQAAAATDHDLRPCWTAAKRPALKSVLL